MSLLPVANDKVQLTLGVVSANDAYQNGIRVSATQLARSSLASGLYFNGGLSKTVDGQLTYVDSTAGLPAGVQFCNGLPLSSSGQLCISTGSAVTYSNGIPFTANGAVSAAIV